MKKKLFLGAFLIGSLCTMSAQQTCATAMPVSAGTLTAPQITGTYNDLCFDFGEQTAGGEPMKALWYRYTPTTDGTLTVSSNLPENNGTTFSDDTKLSIFTGTCSALVCAHSADDNVGGPFLETLEFEVDGGETYYIQWDNFQNSLGFKFTVAFDPDDVPPVAVPYTFNFETNPFTQGWTRELIGGGSWFWDTVENPAQSGIGSVVVVGPDTPTDTWLFSRGIQLTAGQIIDVNYYIGVNVVGAGAPISLQVTAGANATAAAQTTVLGTFTNVSNTAYAAKSNVFTAPANGIYYIGFHTTAPAHAFDNRSTLLLDTFSVETGTAGIEDNMLSNLVVYPNPASDNITIAYSDNVLINGAEIIDLNGRTIKSYKYDGTANTVIPVSDLAQGMYLLKVLSAEGTVTKRIVKK